MNVLVVTNLYPNRAEPGRAPYNRQQISALQAHARIRVVAPVFWAAPGARGVASAGPENWDGIQVYHPLYVYPPRLGRATHGVFYWASIARTLGRLWRQEPWDVLYGTWLFPDGVAVAKASRRYGRPFVLKAHGSDVNEVATYRVRRVLIRRAVGRAAAVVVVSRALRERLISLGIPAQKVRLLYNGVDTKRFRPLDRQWARRTLGIPEDHRLLLFVGNLKEAKGPGIFVEALGQLTRDGVEAAGTLVGDGPYRAVVEEKIQTYRLGERIRLAGIAEHHEMPTWYAAADAVCLPSLMEGVPNVVLEALACGRPVVATAVGGIPEVMDGTCGVLVPSRDPVAVASGLAEVLRHSWDPAALAERVANLSWDANGRDLARILAQAAGAAP